MVGEGVLIAALAHDIISEVLIINRKHVAIQHPKLKELIVPDFMQLEKYNDAIQGYDACFYCAGISSIGMNEEDFTKITYDTTLHFAKIFLANNPNSVFTYVSGKSTDSTGVGKIMWARVKGKTEIELMKMGFKGAYNFRPGYMDPFKEQKNVKGILKFFGLFYPKLFPKSTIHLKELANAMISVTVKGFDKNILEISDIKNAAAQLS